MITTQMVAPCLGLDQVSDQPQPSGPRVLAARASFPSSEQFSLLSGAKRPRRVIGGVACLDSYVEISISFP